MAVNEKRITLEVEGIVCAGCATDTETVLRQTNGIFAADVRYADGRIIIGYDPNEISRDAVIEKVKGLGFKIRLMG